MDIASRYLDPDQFKNDLTGAQAADVQVFVAAFNRNIARYRDVAAAVDLPIPLVAAIHWREASGDFSTYLHNGDPLGRPTVNEPKGILFTDWESAAKDALSLEREPNAWKLSGFPLSGDVLPEICTFAEAYNGTGYVKRGFPSPYVLAGTTGYIVGKFTADGHFDESATDKQVGVLALVRAIS